MTSKEHDQMSIYRGAGAAPGEGDGASPLRRGGHISIHFSVSNPGKQLEGSSTQHKNSRSNGVPPPINFWKHLSSPIGCSRS